MGTNYNWYPKEKCTHCMGKHDSIHIGKSSYGWRFSLHVEPDEKIECDNKEYYITGLEDWKFLFNIPGSTIVDKNGKTITPEEMITIITDRQKYYKLVHPDTELLCHELDGKFCIGIADDGDYDLVAGVFS